MILESSSHFIENKMLKISDYCVSFYKLHGFLFHRDCTLQTLYCPQNDVKVSVFFESY